MALKVVGGGLGRTGTMSLKLALEQLGLGPCHHMEEVLKDPVRQVPLWNAAIQGKPDWNAIFAGYNSAVDWPTAAFWRELAASYPQAKVILTVRGAESWYESISGTILALMSMPEQWPPPIRPVFEMATKIVRERSFPGGLDRDQIIQTFNAHVDAVKTAIPAERLLVYEVKEGWGPLCEFLGEPVPSTPFPKTNSKEEFWNLVNGPPQ